MGFAVSLQGFAFPAARMTPMRGRGFLTLALIALAVLLVQPVCAVLASHAVAGVTAVAPDAGGAHDVPCCSSIDSASLVKMTAVTSLTRTGTPSDALAAASPQALVSRPALAYRYATLSARPGAPPLAYYARSARILR